MAGKQSRGAELQDTELDATTSSINLATFLGFAACFHCSVKDIRKRSLRWSITAVDTRRVHSVLNSGGQVSKMATANEKDMDFTNEVLHKDSPYIIFSDFDG